ncbi:MAG: LuxR C-terminal-related transcriptional regulator [Balneolaceae bacterium]
MKPIPVLLADKADISRAGIDTILREASGIHVLHAVKSAKELIKLYNNHPDSVCVIASSVSDTNVHELMSHLLAVNPNAHVLVVSGNADLMHLNLALKSGVKGYVTKNVSGKELIHVLKSVHAGERSFSKSVSKLIVGKYADGTRRAQPFKSVTKREKEILSLIVEGYTSAEIADMLYISPRTVETHRSNLMQKLKIKNTAGLVRYALEQQNIA